MDRTPTPFQWLWLTLCAAGWPVIVVLAYRLGRYIERVETRLKKVETGVTSMLERHLPSIHQALSEIRGMMRGGK